MTFRNGQTVYRKGDRQCAIYFIKSGSCEAIYTREAEVLRLHKRPPPPRKTFRRQADAKLNDTDDNSDSDEDSLGIDGGDGGSGSNSGGSSGGSSAFADGFADPGSDTPRQKVAVFEPAQWFGDLSALTDNVARFTVVAKGAVVVWRLQKERLPQLGGAYTRAGD